jgi:hypothetical protein
MVTAFSCLRHGPQHSVVRTPKHIIDPRPTQVYELALKEAWVNPHCPLRSPNYNTSQSHLCNDPCVNPRQVDTAVRPIESAPIYHVTSKNRINNPACWDFHCFLTMKTKRRANTLQRGTALLPKQDQVGTSRDSHGLHVCTLSAQIL